MHVLVLADGDPPSRSALDAAWPAWDAGVALVVAADGGARHAGRLGLAVDAWVGDGDSLGMDALAALRSAGCTITMAPTDKDESDTELAVTAAIEAGASRLTIVGALGGPRLDHALANLGLLALPALAAVDARIVTDTARVRLLTAPTPSGGDGTATLEGRVGDLVSLFPVGDPADRVTTAGLRYPLSAATLLPGRTRGLSNVRTAPLATVILARGRLLIVEAPATL